MLKHRKTDLQYMLCCTLVRRTLAGNNSRVAYFSKAFWIAEGGFSLINRTQARKLGCIHWIVKKSASGFSVPDPDVFGPPGSGSVIILYGSGSESINKRKNFKNLDFCCLVTSLWLFIFEDWCNLPTDNKKQNKCKKKLVFCWHLEVTDEKGRIRIRSKIWSKDPDPDP